MSFNSIKEGRLALILGLAFQSKWTELRPRRKFQRFRCNHFDQATLMYPENHVPVREPVDRRAIDLDKSNHLIRQRERRLAHSTRSRNCVN